jgi:predicted metal-binding protein
MPSPVFRQPLLFRCGVFLLIVKCSSSITIFSMPSESQKRKPDALSNKALRALVLTQPGVLGARVISPSKVETAEWVRLKCRFGCAGFGQCFVCPPYSPTPKRMRKVLDSYRRAILIHFDSDADTKSIVVNLEREIFLRGAWKAFGLGAGPCYFCKECSLEKGHCRNPEKARPAMEACGIDVFSTARKFGFRIEVITSTRQTPNYFGLLLID